MKDRRRPPFAYQELAATALIREAYDGAKRLTALAIYQTLSEVANEQRTREEFEATRGEIGDRAGCSRDTLDRYVKGFVKLGIVEVERRVGDGGVNLPNVWTLISPEGGRTAAATPGVPAPPGRTDAATPGRASAATLAAEGGRTDAAPTRMGAADPRARLNRLQEEQQRLEEGIQEERQEAPPDPPQAGGSRPVAPAGGRQRDLAAYRLEEQTWLDANAPHPTSAQAAQLSEWWAPRAVALKEIVGETTYELWCSSLHPHAVVDGVLFLGVSKEHHGWIASRFGQIASHLIGDRSWEAVPCSESLTKENTSVDHDHHAAQ